MTTIQPFNGATTFDTPEIRGLRIHALAETQNLMNALTNGAYPNALVYRAEHLATAVRNLAETLMDTPHMEDRVEDHVDH